MRLAMAVVALALVAIACGSERDLADLDLDAVDLVTRSTGVMNELDSYHVRFTITAHPEDVREEHVWEFDVVRPDSYRVVLHSVEGAEKEVCETRGHGGTCTIVLTSITKRSRFEGLYVGDFAYSRECDGDGDHCGDWEREARPELLVFGPSPSYLPQWPIVALEMIDDAESVELVRIAGVETVLIRGKLNLLRAVLENQRRLLEPLGITTFSTQCSSGGVPMNVEGDTFTCRDLSFEETLERQDNVAFQDENPPTVDVWISPEDGRLHRITITGPFEDGGLPEPMTIDYSDFNGVSLEAPEILEDAE